jgi:hypothetical protein
VALTGTSTPESTQGAAPESAPPRSASPELMGIDHATKAQSASWSAATAPPQTTQSPAEPERSPASHQPRPHSGAFSKKSAKRQTTVDPAKGEIEVEIDGEMRAVRSQIQLYAQ